MGMVKILNAEFALNMYDAHDARRVESALERFDTTRIELQKSASRPNTSRKHVPQHLNALMPFLETARTEKSLGISATCLFASTQSAVSKTLLLLTRKKRCPNAIQHIFPIDKNEHSN